MVGKGQDLVIYSDEAVAPYVSFEYRFPFAVVIVTSSNVLSGG